MSYGEMINMPMSCFFAASIARELALAAEPEPEADPATAAAEPDPSAFPLAWQPRVDNLCRRFPGAGKDAVVAVLHMHDGHAGMAAGHLQDPDRAQEKLKHKAKEKAAEAEREAKEQAAKAEREAKIAAELAMMRLEGTIARDIREGNWLVPKSPGLLRALDAAYLRLALGMLLHARLAPECVTPALLECAHTIAESIQAQPLPVRPPLPPPSPAMPAVLLVLRTIICRV